MEIGRAVCRSVINPCKSHLPGFSDLSDVVQKRKETEKKLRQKYSTGLSVSVA